jgi:iron complex outermembrane recepter protein
VHRLSALAVLCAAVGLAQAAAADEQGRLRFAVNIQSESLPDALDQLSEQARAQILHRAPDSGQEPNAQGVRGTFSLKEALDRLLQNTGYRYELINDRTVRVWAATDRPNAAKQEANNEEERPSALAQSHPRETQEVAPAQADPTQGRQNQPPNSSLLAEVIVTAQKRSERLQDVPVPVTVLDVDALADTNQSRLQDYYATVPGLNFVSSSTGLVQLAIRGVTTAGFFTNPTVGITVDDVPYGPSSGLAFAGNTVPDIDPSDLAHIEVLRGPQGTLYGAASIGGLIKYVTADPSKDAISARVQVDGDSIYNGHGPGYELRGAMNVPVSETLSVRASGSTRHEPGYVDDPTTHVNAVNPTRSRSGRLSALWAPSEEFSLKLGAMLNSITADGNSDVNVNLGSGDLLQSMVRGTGGYSQRLQLYSANLNAKIAGFDITSITGYQINKVIHHGDSSPLYSSAFFPVSQIVYGVDGATTTDNVETKKFTQEVRLARTVAQKVDILLGGFYTHEANETDQLASGADPASGTSVGLLGDFYFPTTFTESAAFVDATVHLTDRFDIQFGGRESTNRQRYYEIDSGPYISFIGFQNPLSFPTIHTKDSAFTYLVTPRVKLTKDFMIYARVASGYRPGGPNSAASLFSFPSHFDADKTVNYEVGVKGDLLENALSFDASIYYINWRDIQVSIVDPQSFYAYFTNASSAKSQGVELSAQASPFNGLTIAGWAAWNEAVLTSNLPISSGSAIGLSGDELPFSSRWSTNVSVGWDFPISPGVAALVGGSVSYVGKRFGNFAGNLSQERAELPGYAKIDVRAGLRYSSWALHAFINNVADKRGVLNLTYIGTDTFYTYIVPRTIGLSVSKTF